MEKQRTNFQLPDDPARPSILMRQMLPTSFFGSICMVVSVLIPDLELFIIYTMVTSVFWGVTFYFSNKTEEYMIFGQISPLTALY